MAIAPKVEDEVAELVRALPAHLRANFEKADGRIRELYGEGPGLSALVRLWLACGTSARIQREFESAVLDITRKTVGAPEEELFDDDDF